MKSFDEFISVVEQLRSPDGCPWDREQTFKSLVPFIIEEAICAKAKQRNNACHDQKYDGKHNIDVQEPRGANCHAHNTPELSFKVYGRRFLITFPDGGLITH